MPEVNVLSLDPMGHATTCQTRIRSSLDMAIFGPCLLARAGILSLEVFSAPTTTLNCHIQPRTFAKATRLYGVIETRPQAADIRRISKEDGHCDAERREWETH
jgi:hypothetical protein